MPFFILFQFIYIGLGLFGIILALGFLNQTYEETKFNNYELKNIVWLFTVLVGSLTLCGGLAWAIYFYFTEMFPGIISLLLGL